PGDVVAATLLGLANAQSRPRLEAAMVAPEPGVLEVVGEVAGEEELMGRREEGHAACVGLREDRAMTYRERSIGRAGFDIFLGEYTLSVHPSDSRRQRTPRDKPSVVEEGPAVLVGLHDRLDADQASPRPDRETQVARERPARQAADGDMFRSPLAPGAG